MENQIITSPKEWEDGSTSSVFLAGGITNCPDWQSGVAERIADETDFVVVNPRRTNWDMNADESESVKQIQWEHRHLDRCSHVLFWFPEQTLCPITLLELGKYLIKPQILFIGTHANYQRRLDIIEQVRLEREDVQIFDDLDVLVSKFVNEANRLRLIP